MNQRAIEDFFATSAPVDAYIEMKVAIAQGIPALSLITSTEAMVLNPENQPLHQLVAQAPNDIRVNGQGIVLNGMQLPPIIQIVLPPQGLFAMGDRIFRGQLTLVADGDRLWAVNSINLREYLYSVVASEVSPNWPAEALKAQAVAARSYALVHYFRPAASFYHLTNTQRHQVYSGIEREADTIKQAVDATSGEFVSYEGGVVESLYAASDAIVARAFEGRGMSQLGAFNLAEQGYSYDQILGNYYAGTQLARLQLAQ
jgi:peptidoglycan hydrolase-like amidase